MRESCPVHLLHGRGAVRAMLSTALQGSVTNSALSLGGAASRCAALRAAALRCELRAASCCAALLGVGGPEWQARDE